MSLAWSFPAPHGEPGWPGWTLSTSPGWPLDSLDPKLIMRLGPELADRLAGLDPQTIPGRQVYIAWPEERSGACWP